METGCFIINNWIGYLNNSVIYYSIKAMMLIFNCIKFVQKNVSNIKLNSHFHDDSFWFRLYVKEFRSS